MDIRTRRVSEIMQTEVATLAPNEYLDLADDVMRLGRVRHLPVVEDVHLIGPMTETDLLNVAFLVEDAPFEVKVKGPPRRIRAAARTLPGEIRDGDGRIGEMF